MRAFVVVALPMLASCSLYFGDQQQPVHDDDRDADVDEPPDRDAAASLDGPVDAQVDAMTVCRRVVPFLDALLDEDADGIANGTDNCPLVANGEQNNEDGDASGDACDKCPPIADDIELDTDCDGVSDACDPRPTLPGDSIVLFDGFQQPLGNGWNIAGPHRGVSVIGGTLQIDAMKRAITVYSETPPTGHHAVYTQLTDLEHSATERSAVGILHAPSSALDPIVGEFCHITNALSAADACNGAPCGLRLATYTETGQTNSSLLDDPLPGRDAWVLADRYDLDWYSYSGVDYDRLWCLADDHANTLSYELWPQPWNSSPEFYPAGTSDSRVAFATPATVGLRVANARATFHWLLVIQN